MKYPVIALMSCLAMITLIFYKPSMGATFIGKVVSTNTAESCKESVVSGTVVAENRSPSDRRTRRKLAKTRASKDYCGEYDPKQSWSPVFWKIETRGFVFREDGTLIYEETPFSQKILLGDDPSKPKSVVPERLLVSPPSASGRYVFVMSKHPAEEQFVCLIDLVDKKLIPIEGYRHGVSEWVRWSPDEKYALLHEGDHHEVHALYRVNLRDGQFNGLWPAEPPLEIPDGEKPAPRDTKDDQWKNVVELGSEDQFCYDLDSFGDITPDNRISGRVIVSCNAIELENCDPTVIKKGPRVTLDVESMKPASDPMGAAAAPGNPSQQGMDLGSYSGSWVGSYSCRQGLTGLTLELSPGSAGRLKGIFHFFPVESNPNVPYGSFYVYGTLRSDGRLVLRPERWIQRPRNFIAVSLEGRMSSDSQKISGRVSTSGCGDFEIRRKSD